MKRLSLKAKTFILVTTIVIFSAGPLVFYYLKATQSIGALGTDQQIEQSLSRCVDLSVDEKDVAQAAVALKRYGQIKVLKDRIVGEVIMFSIIYSIVMLFLSLGIGYLLIARITRPLKELTAATRRIAHDRPEERLTEKEGGEIGELVKAFNTMVSDLKVAREQRAIAERRATWQHVARTIAHEIKNPLTPIKLSTERLYEKYLMESKDFPEVIKSTTQTVLGEIANLQKLVDTFHRYAKFPDPVLKKESLKDLVGETLALFTSAKVPIVHQIDDGLPELLIDRGQIREALHNLIKNSIEATETTGRPPQIQVSARRKGDEVHCTVRDNGCGIPSENRSRLFQPYFTTKKQGSGIGLALIERIVTLHGGTIMIDSTENVGTEVTIVFRLTNETAGAWGVSPARLA